MPFAEVNDFHGVMFLDNITYTSTPANMKYNSMHYFFKIQPSLCCISDLLGIYSLLLTNLLSLLLTDEHVYQLLQFISDLMVKALIFQALGHRFDSRFTYFGFGHPDSNIGLHL